MATANLEVVITAKDEASAKLKELGEQAKTIGAGFTAAGAAITGALGYMVKQAADAQAGVAQLNAVITSTGGVAGVTAEAAIKMAESFQDITTFSNDAVLGAENMLLTFTNIHSDVFPETTQAVLDMSAAFSASGKSMDISQLAIQVGKALNDPIQGISALTRVGVTFTQQQKDTIKTLVDSGKTMEAQKMILSELNREFGGSATSAAGTFTGQLKQLKNQADDLGKQIGAILIPILSQLLTQIKPIITNMMNWITAHPALTKNIVLVTAAIGALMLVVGPLLLALPGLIIFFTALAGPVGIVIAIIIGLAVVVKNLIDIFFMFKNDSKLIWDGIVISFKEWIGSIVGFFQPLIDLLDRVISKIAQVAAATGGKIKGAVGAVTGAVSGAWNAVTSFFGGKANGGNVRSGDSYMVGERGQEVFTPATDGFISPVNGRGNGGGGIVVNINGGNYLSQDAARMMGDYLIKNLQRVARV